MTLETYCVADQVYKELEKWKMTLSYLEDRGTNRDLCCSSEYMYNCMYLTFPKEILPDVFGKLKEYAEKKVKELEQQFEKL